VQKTSEELMNEIQKLQAEEGELIQQLKQDELKVNNASLLTKSKTQDQLSNTLEKLSKVQEKIGKKSVACSSVLYEKAKSLKKQLEASETSNNQLTIQGKEIKEELEKERTKNAELKKNLVLLKSKLISELGVDLKELETRIEVLENK
jgi:hypothetical protein